MQQNEAHRPELRALAAAAAVIAVLVAMAAIIHAMPARAQAASPPQSLSMADIANGKSRPIFASEEKTFGQAVTTSTVNAMGTAAQTADVTYLGDMVQTFRIVNTHASNFLCYRTIARAASATSCDTKCTGLGAGIITCTGSGAADGTLIPPGGVLTPSISGLDCACIEASAAATNVNATRVARLVQ